MSAIKTTIKKKLKKGYLNKSKNKIIKNSKKKFSCEKERSVGISVLMPVYNAEKYVGQAIESILEQTFKNFELIIIDDASTDASYNVIQKYAKKDKRIKVFKNTHNQGIGANRNRLVKLASGKYIAWQDADDISLPTRLAKQYQFMENNPQVGICGAWIQFFNEEGDFAIRKYAAEDSNLRKTVFSYSPVAQPVAILRKEIFKNNNYFYDNTLSPVEDLDMSFKIGERWQFANLQEILLKYRQHSNNSSLQSKKLKDTIKKTLIVRKKYTTSSSYNYSFLDQIKQEITRLILLLPSNLILKIFSLLRDSK